jgi:hypothetical protein
MLKGHGRGALGILNVSAQQSSEALSAAETAELPSAIGRNSGHDCCWAIRYKAPEIAYYLENEIEMKLFPGYIFYPEIEWPKYGCVPPETLPVLGAWRRVTGDAFAFLLEVAAGRGKDRTRQVRLYFYGPEDEIKRCEPRLVAIKSDLMRFQRQTLRTEEELKLFNGQFHSRAVRQILLLLTLVTTVTNAASYYLRRTNFADIPEGFLKSFYLEIVQCINIAALILLLSLAFVCMGYIFRYARVLLRRI